MCHTHVMGKIAGVEVAVDRAAYHHSLPPYLLLTSLFSFQDAVLGGNPPRRLSTFFAEFLGTRHTAPRITATSGNSPRFRKITRFNGFDHSRQIPLPYYQGKMLSYGKFYGDSTFLSLSNRRLSRLFISCASLGRVRRQTAT